MRGNASRTDASHTAAASCPTYHQTRGRRYSSLHAGPRTPPHADVDSASAAVNGVLAVAVSVARVLRADSAATQQAEVELAAVEVQEPGEAGVQAWLSRANARSHSMV